MPATPNHLKVTPIQEDARLFFADPATGFEARFFTSLPRSEAAIPGITGLQFYSHAIIEGRRWQWRFDADMDGAFNFGETHAAETRRQGIIVAPDHAVDWLIASTLGLTEKEVAADLTSPADKLLKFLGTGSLRLSGVMIDAFAAYSEEQGRLTLVDADGGFTVGPGREGAVTEAELHRMVCRPACTMPGTGSMTISGGMVA